MNKHQVIQKVISTEVLSNLAEWGFYCLIFFLVFGCIFDCSDTGNMIVFATSGILTVALLVSSLSLFIFRLIYRRRIS